MTALKRINDGVLLCCGKAKCPVVRLQENEQLTISDDYGNTVKLDVEQAKLINKAIDQLKEKE